MKLITYLSEQALGLPTNMMWDGIKAAYSHITHKDWADLWVAAFEQAARLVERHSRQPLVIHDERLKKA